MKAYVKVIESLLKKPDDEEVVLPEGEEPVAKVLTFAEAVKEELVVIEPKKKKRLPIL